MLQVLWINIFDFNIYCEGFVFNEAYDTASTRNNKERINNRKEDVFQWVLLNGMAIDLYQNIV